MNSKWLDIAQMVKEDGRGRSDVWTHNRVTGEVGVSCAPPGWGVLLRRQLRMVCLKENPGFLESEGEGGKWLWARV